MPTAHAPAFLSYAREDSASALRIAADLKRAGTMVWLDQIDIRPGQQWDLEVENALATCAEMIVILSRAAVVSKNVMDEIGYALEENKRVIPLMIEDCRIPLRLRRVQHIDFRSDYQRALETLISTVEDQHDIGITVAAGIGTETAPIDTPGVQERYQSARDADREGEQERKARRNEEAYTIRKRWLSAAAYSGIFAFGIVMALLGAVLPLLSARFHLNMAQAGTLFLVMNSAMLVTSLAIGPLLDRFGMKPPLTTGPLLVGIALALIARAWSYSVLLAAVLVLGAGGAVLNSTTNTLIADVHCDPRRKSAALNLLGVFFGIGALLVPLIIGGVVEALGLEPILYIAIALVLITAAIAMAQRFPPPKQEGAFVLKEFGGLARDPLVLSYAGLLFFESGNEFILGGFVSSYLVREVGMAVSAASYLLTCYWAALMAARILISRILLVISGEVLVRWSAALTAVSVVLLLAARGPAVGFIAVVLLGAGIAGIYPTTLGLAGTHFERQSGAVFGILISIGLVGGMTLPWLVGQIAAAFTLRAALVVAAADALAIMAFLSLSRRAAARASLRT